MLLHDIGKSPDATFRRINQHLETNYGFKISEDVSDKDLVSIMEQLEEEITDLKVKGDDAKGSSEISKRLLVLEGIKSLREYAITQLKSPKLDSVVNGLADYVADTFEITGRDSIDFERAVERAMDEYRSSRYRFPDDFIEQRVRHEAMSRIEQHTSMNSADDAGFVVPSLMMEDDDMDTAEGDSENNGIEENDASIDFDDSKMVPMIRNPHTGKSQLDPFAARAAQLKKGVAPDQSPATEEIPMVRDKHGNRVPDPFAAHAAERRKGIAMKEHANLVKNLRRLLETEVSQAEVMMAAKGFSQELQEMVEKIGRLQNEDLPPVTDQMRETYGTDSASTFQTQIYGALQGVMDSLYTAKQQVDDAVSSMATTGQVGAMTDMDKDIGMDAGMDGDMGADPSMDGDLDLDNIGDELGAEAGDEFGGEEALGRSKKMESVLQRKVMEMQRLVQKARKLKESQN